MNRLQKTSRYFLEYLLPVESLDEDERCRLREALREEGVDDYSQLARELAESLARKGVYEKLDEGSYRDPGTGTQFSFRQANAVAPPQAEIISPEPAREVEPAQEVGRALSPPQADELEEIYDDVLAAIRLEESTPGAEPGLGRLLSLLARWEPEVQYQLFSFLETPDFDEVLGEKIRFLELETLAQGHPYRQAINRRVSLQIDVDDPSFLHFPIREKGKNRRVYLLPLFLDGRPWGILDVVFPGQKKSNRLEGKLQLLASALSHQIYNHRILSKVVFVDWLTQVYNRTFLEIQVPLEVEKARRNQENLALLMVDLDDFKRINDSWGHDRGDRVLRDFAGVLQRTLRRVDQIYRFGGEEFVILLPGLDRSRARRTGERILEAIREHRYRVAEGQDRVRLTASIGVAIFPDDGQDDVQLFKVADDACYKAKSLGKDQMAFSEES